MVDYYWKLEEYKGANTRFRCPTCNKPREYTRFVNSVGEYAPFEYGACNRLNKCGYFKYPNGVETNAPVYSPEKLQQEFINWNDYNYSLNTDSDLVKYMISFFNDETKVIETLKKYHVRTDNNFMIFPCIDLRNRITYAKSMLYKNGHRTKKIFSTKKANSGVFEQCLFGLHLVGTSKQINVVESEKTALICDIFYPQYTWVATGGQQLISKIDVLEKATIYADKGIAFEKWSDSIDTTRFTMNDILEKTDLPEGSDLADYILKR